MFLSSQWWPLPAYTNHVENELKTVITVKYLLKKLYFTPFFGNLSKFFNEFTLQILNYMVNSIQEFKSSTIK